jgi:hypothetical protein
MRWKTIKLLLPSLFIGIGSGGYWDSRDIGLTVFGVCVFIAMLLCEDK